MASLQTTTQQKQKVLPLQDPNNPYTSTIVVQPPQNQAPTITPETIQPVAAPQSPTSQMAAQTLQKASTAANTGYQSPTAQQVSQQTQTLLKDPNMGYDPNKVVSQGLTEFDRNLANAMETARAGLVGASGSSEAQAGLRDLALRSMEKRASIKNELERTANEQTLTNVINALASGRETVGMEQGIQQGNLQGLISVLSAAEPQLQREETAFDRGIQIATANQNAQLQTLLTKMQGDIQMGLQVNQQEWEGVQNELNRVLDKEISSGNWQNALDVQTLKGEIDQTLQENNQRWSSAERVATQSWQTEERLDQNTHDDAQNLLDRELQKAIADGDNATMKWVEERKAELALTLQLKDQTHDEKMLTLQTMADEAKAVNDVKREMQILNYKSKITMQEMEKDYGYKAALETIRGEIEKDIQTGNNDAAMERLKAELQYRTLADIEDKKIEWAKLELEKRGVDIAQLNQQMSAIDDMIQNYGINPAMKTEFVKATLEGQGVNTDMFQAEDITKRAQKAIDEQFEMTKYQFFATHPQYTLDTQDTAKKQEAMNAFNEYWNYTMYGELTDEMKEDRASVGYLDKTQIANAQEGDKFKFKEDVAWTVSGAGDQLIPAGTYTVITESATHGSSFFGTQRNTNDWILVNDKTGDRYVARNSVTAGQGNFLSDLWLDDWVTTYEN